MGVDYTGTRFLGTANVKSTLRKLPRFVRGSLKDDPEYFHSEKYTEWNGLKIFTTYSNEQVGIGFNFQSYELTPELEEPAPPDKVALFKSVGINPQVYGYVEIW